MGEPRKFDRRFLPFLILSLGLVLRVYAAVSHLDISHPDEHFQTLEPASHVVFGFGWLSWEWTAGLRSWFVPGLYMPLLWVFKALGFNGGPAPIMGSRVMMALLCTWMMWEFWVLYRDSGLKRGASLLALAVFALSPACSAWGAMTLSDVWAMAFLWCAMPFVLRAIERNEKLVLAGGLLGLSFLARIQMVLWPIGIAAVLLLRKPFRFRMVLRLALGYGIAIAFQGILDWVTWGTPFHSVVANIENNLFHHVASFYGVSPWYDYLLSVPEHLGWPIVFGAISVSALALLARKAKLRERELLILVPAVLYLAVHSAIPHKELRFMFPVIPVFFYFLAWGLSAFEFRWSFREDLVGLVLVMTCVFSMGFVYSTDHTYQFDLSAITQKIREDGGLKHGGCLVLLDHYWIWTRGELMIGAPIQFMELSSSKPVPDAANTCRYAITLPGREQWFSNDRGAHWRIIYRDNHGQILYKRVSP